MDLLPGLPVDDAMSLIGGAAGSGGGAVVLGALVRMWLKSQRQQLCALTKAVTEARTEAKDGVATLKKEIQDDVASLKSDFLRELGSLKEAMQKEISEIGTKLAAHELEIRNQDKFTVRLEARLLVVEDRAATANQMRQEFEDFRDRTLTAISQLGARTEALFDIAAGKRKPWDREEAPATSQPNQLKPTKEAS